VAQIFLLAGCCVLFVSKHQRNEHWHRPRKITHWHHHFLIYHSTSEGKGIALWRQYTYYSRGTVLFVIGCFYLEFSALVWVVCVTTHYWLAGHTSGEHNLHFLGHSLVSCFAAVLLYSRVLYTEYWWTGKCFQRHFEINWYRYQTACYLCLSKSNSVFQGRFCHFRSMSSDLIPLHEPHSMVHLYLLVLWAVHPS